ncbi:MAG TPA: non-homologous end-joining DNA ligase [Acidimicrobiales bacterium]|nr:non-homologous end-joining DNA ligase [Acidimicrobiales bacterium]
MTLVEIEGRQLKLSNLDKVLYPAVGFTKAQVIDYYSRIAPVLLTHLSGRPLTLKRYPNGVDEKFFYEKRCPSHRPKWMRTLSVWSERNKGEVPYCLVDELASVVWVANMASLELHTSLSRAPIERPTAVVFDLDPGPGTGVAECAQVALRLREVLAETGLEMWVKTSGSKGLQPYVPLNTEVTYEGPGGTKDFARGLAERLEKEQPKAVVSKMAKALRPGKVFIDWSQNDMHKTTVCVYSLRAKARPTVSTPVSWEEVEAAADGRDPLVFETQDVLARIEERGDLFASVESTEQELPAA